MAWEFRQPTKVMKYERAEMLAGEDDEVIDVSGFNPPTWIVTFEVRRAFSLFGRRLWTGNWQPMQMVCR